MFLCVAIVGREPLFGISTAEVKIEPVAAMLEEKTLTPQKTVDKPLVVEAAAPQIKASTAVVIEKAKQEDPFEIVFRPAELDQQSESQVVVEEPVAKLNPVEVAFQADSLLESEVVELLHEARAAFWNGSLENAESLYLRYLEQRPEDANGFGELGNLFQSMGRTKDSLNAYFEAGVRFKMLGDREQLEQILELLDETDDERAALLRE